MKSLHRNILACLWIIAMTTPTVDAAADSQTIYTVSLEGREVGCELVVNDIPVISNDYGGKLSRIPVNHFLVDGSNTLKVRTLLVDAETRKHPSFIADSPRYCKAVVSGPKGKDGPGAKLAEVEAKWTEPNPAWSKEETFTATLGFGSPAWAHAVKIGKDAATQKRLLDKFQEFHRLLEKKNLNAILKFSAVKNGAYAKAFYMPDFEAKNKASYEEQFAGAGKLIGIDEQAKFGLTYEYYYGDRLVTFKNDENRSIIQYYDTEEETTTEYELIFYFDGKDFVLVL